MAGALPAALAQRGHHVRVMTPLYAGVPRDALVDEAKPLTLTFPFGEVAAGYHSVEPRPRLTVTFVENAAFFDRPTLYGPPDQDFADNAERFAFFTLAALSGATHLGFEPDVVHLNDWQTGLGALALKTGYRPAPPTLFTIHNLAYQGNFDASVMGRLGIPWSHFTVDGLEYWQKVSFLKAGIQFADAVSTVSPQYAREIQTPEFGMGFDGLVRHRAPVLHGLLNGIDSTEWNPATDVLLPATFSAADLSGREVCRRTLLERAKLQAPAPGMPVFGIIGRMVEQKGVDLLHATLPAFFEHGACAVVLGSGAPRFENEWRALQARFSSRLSVTVGFDNALAHLIEAGADFFIMPSRFEPCGLNQMYSLAYGAVPVVHAVGGLRDTVVDLRDANGTGVWFHEPTADALRGALGRAVDLFRDPPRYARVRATGMRQDFSWQHAAGGYEDVYRALAAARGPG